MHIYSDFTIDELKKELMEKSMRDNVPRKYAVPMFSAYEVICQLQRDQEMNKNNG